MDYEHPPFTEADRAQYVALLRREADVVRPEVSVDVVRDADHDKFINAALAADADYVVLGTAACSASGRTATSRFSPRRVRQSR